MKIARNLLFGTIATAFLIAQPGISSSLPNAAGVPTQIVVTVQPVRGAAAPEKLQADDLAVTVDKTPARVLRSERLTGDLARTQLYILLDDSTRSSSLGIQLPELKAFVRSLPATTEVAIGYMRNGTAAKTQDFTSDHNRAADSLRLPQGLPGGNGSPYFALSDLAKHWPSEQSSERRVVLMLTDGVDRYYDNSIVEDPYVDAAIHDSLKQGLIVYSIYVRDTGLYDRGAQTTLFAQSRLGMVSDQTGGYAYFQDFTDPVSVKPFLNDFQNRLDHQYRITVQAFNAGIQPVQIRSELPTVKMQGPTRVFVR